jgi:hypothetical protein
MPIIFDTPGHWRERAEEARTMAASVKDREVRRAMLDVAESYEKLAMLAGARASGRLLILDKDE